MNTGIRPRHEHACPARKGGDCRCKPAYQAAAYDAATGKRIYRTFKARSEAKNWRSDAKAELRKGDLSSDRGPLLRDAIEQWLEDLRNGNITNRSGDEYKPAAIRDYKRNLRLRILPAIGDLRVREVTPPDVQAIVDDLVRRGLASATIDAAITPLKAFYRRAVSRGNAKLNPTIGIEKPAVRSKQRQVVDVEQVEKMIAALDPGERALWATAIYAGLRRGELIGLRRDDVDLASGVIHVRRGWDMVENREIAPKSRQGKRKVPIAAVLRDYLDQRLLEHNDECVFGDPRWISRTNDRARERWQDRGLPVLTLHAARHVCASYWIDAGLNIKAISTFMGHATIAITLDLYGHLLPGSEVEATDLLDNYFARQVGSTVASTVANAAITALQSQ